MSRRQRRASNSVQLFPFLAVLICAMGSLCVLVIVTSSRIRAEAVAAAREALEAASAGEAEPAFDPPIDPEEPGPTLVPPDEPVAAPAPANPPVAIDPPPDPDEAVRAAIAARAQQREEEQRRVDDRRRAVAALQKRIEESETALRAAEIRARDATSADREDAAARARLEAERRRLGDELAELRQRLRLAQAKRTDAPSKFTFVPYDGASGTTRRPILIECTSDGIRFLPENVMLGPADVAGFTPGFNPVLAGASALSRYWTAVDGIDSAGNASPPYVLLIVRPSGAVAYYYARKLLSRMDVPYGYELIDDAVQLDLPAADSRARSICQAAVDDALAERNRILAEHRGGTDARSPRGGLPGNGGREIMYRPGAGFEVVESGQAPLADDPFEKAAAAAIAANGELPESIGRRTDPGGSRGSGGTGAPGAGRPGGVATPAPPRAFHGGSAGRPIGGVPNAVEGNGIVSRGDRSNPTATGGPLGRPGDAEVGTTNAGSTAAGGEGAPATSARPDAAGSNRGKAALLSDAAGANRAGSRTPEGRFPPDGDPEGTQEEPDLAPIPPGGAGGPNARGSTDPHTATVRGNGTGATPGDGPAPETRPSATGQTGTGRPTPNRNGKPGGDGTSGGGSSLSGDPSEGPPETGRAIDEPPQRFGRSMPRLDSTPRPRNRRWGEYSRRATIGFERQVSVQVLPDRLIVGKTQEVVPASDRDAPEDIVEGLAAALDREALSWGRPPDSFYWVPSVQFEAPLEKHRMVEGLRGPLKSLGLATSVKEPRPAKAR